jgi:serine/threonine protein phosphatase PrpC
MKLSSLIVSAAKKCSQAFRKIKNCCLPSKRAPESVEYTRLESGDASNVVLNYEAHTMLSEDEALPQSYIHTIRGQKPDAIQNGSYDEHANNMNSLCVGYFPGEAIALMVLASGSGPMGYEVSHFISGSLKSRILSMIRKRQYPSIEQLIIDACWLTEQEARSYAQTTHADLYFRGAYTSGCSVAIILKIDSDIYVTNVGDTGVRLITFDAGVELTNFDSPTASFLNLTSTASHRYIAPVVTHMSLNEPAAGVADTMCHLTLCSRTMLRYTHPNTFQRLLQPDINAGLNAQLIAESATEMGRVHGSGEASICAFLTIPDRVAFH